MYGDNNFPPSTTYGTSTEDGEPTQLETNILSAPSYTPQNIYHTQNSPIDYLIPNHKKSSSNISLSQFAKTEQRDPLNYLASG
jgi:hypothetical protein